MKTEKLRAALDDLQSQRIELDLELERVDNAIKAIQEVLQPSGIAAVNGPSAVAESPKVANTETYVDLAVRAIEKAGRPLPIAKIIDFVRDAKRNPKLHRNTIESTIVRHIKLQGIDARVLKIGRGMYAIPQRRKEATPLLLEEAKTDGMVV